MATTLDAPADTTMMRIVHDALRRDLARANVALTRADGSSHAQRRSIGTHLAWTAGLVADRSDDDDARRTVDAMPIVSRLVTAAEWQALEKEHNLDPKSRSELGFEGHWLIDGTSEADRATVLGLVPPVPRFLLLSGYARR